MLLALITLLGPARAGFHEDLAELHAEGANVSFACGSAERAAHTIRQVMDNAGELPADRGDDMASLLAFLSTDPAHGAFATDGGFATGFDDAKHFSLLLHTTLSPEQIAQRMVTEPGESYEAAPGSAGFIFHTTSGDQSITAVKGGVKVSAGLGGRAAGADDPVLNALPDSGGGCVVLADLPKGSSNPALAVMSNGGRVGVYVPLDSHETARFAMEIPSATMPVLHAAGVPADVRTPIPPDMWMTLGFSFAQSDFSQLASEKAKEMRRAQKFLPVDGGITVGMFYADKPQFGAVLPLTKQWSAKKVLSHVRTGLKQVDSAVVNEVADDRIDVTMAGRTFLVSARKGAILVATTPALTSALAVNAGQPWLTPQQRERAAPWLIAAEVRTMPASLALTPAEPMWFAMGVEGGLIVGEAVLPLGEAGWGMAFKLLGAMGNSRRAPGASSPI